MFTETELDTLLDGLYALRDAQEADLDVLLDHGFAVLDPRRVAIQTKINKIESLIVKINSDYGRL